MTVVSFALQCIKLHFSLDCSVSYRRPLKDSSEAQRLLECSLQIPCVQLLQYQVLYVVNLCRTFWIALSLTGTRCP